MGSISHLKFRKDSLYQKLTGPLRPLISYYKYQIQQEEAEEL